MSTTIFGKAAIFFSVHTGDTQCTLGTSLGSFSDKKNATISARETNRTKNRCLRLPRHTGNPQLKYGNASATTAWKMKSTRTPSLVSPYEKTGDSRFAPNLLPYTGVRAVFSGSRAQLWERSMHVFCVHTYLARTTINQLFPWFSPLARFFFFRQQALTRKSALSAYV